MTMPMTVRNPPATSRVQPAVRSGRPLTASTLPAIERAAYRTAPLQNPSCNNRGVNDARIRPRDAADLPRCVAALAEVHATDGYPTCWPADPVAWLTPSDTLNAWTAEAEGEIVGQVVLRAGPTGEIAGALSQTAGVPPEQLASLSRLFVVPRARRLGVGAALLQRAHEEASTRRLRLTLCVVDDERGAARALYERAGWLHVTSTHADWTTPDGTHPLEHHYLSPPYKEAEAIGSP